MKIAEIIKLLDDQIEEVFYNSNSYSITVFHKGTSQDAQRIGLKIANHNITFWGGWLDKINFYSVS